ncbi:hypothetical protein ACLB2K_036134 [Fragaria x ananassa]
MVEVAVVSQILRNLYKEWIDSKQNLSIGVVSPYAAQVVAIEDKLGQKYNNLDGFIVKVKTVDGFQGGEEDIIIFSTVRSNCQQSLEFISKRRELMLLLQGQDMSYINLHCLWILGNERTLCESESVWEALVLDAKNRQCFFNADEDEDLAKAILQVKKQFDQLDDLLNSDSVLFRRARWKVLFSDNFLKSFKKLKSVSLKRSVLNVLLKLASGWRPKMQSSDILCDEYINLCKEKCLEGDLEVPKSWPSSLEFLRFKDLSCTDIQNDLVGDTSDGRSYVENSRVSESLLLMKFYSLSSGVVNHLLSDHEDTEGKVLHQLFVSVSPKLCYAIKQHVLHLKRHGGNSGR